MEQVSALRDRCPHEQPGVRAAADSDAAKSRATVRQQPLRSRDEIVERILTVLTLSSQVPLLAEFGTTAQGGSGEQESSLQQDADKSSESRCYAFAKTTVACKEGR